MVTLDLILKVYHKRFDDYAWQELLSALSRERERFFLVVVSELANSLT